MKRAKNFEVLPFYEKLRILGKFQTRRCDFNRGDLHLTILKAITLIAQENHFNRLLWWEGEMEHFSEFRAIFSFKKKDGEFSSQSQKFKK